jgi:hypothetical protein
MPRPLSHADHLKFVQTEGWVKKGSARGRTKTGDHHRYVLRLSTGEVLSTRVSHGSGGIGDQQIVSTILHKQLQVTEDDFYKCVRQGVLPPRPAPEVPAPPADSLDGKLVRNLITKVKMPKEEIARLTKEEAVAAWQAYLSSGGR